MPSFSKIDKLLIHSNIFNQNQFPIRSDLSTETGFYSF